MTTGFFSWHWTRSTVLKDVRLFWSYGTRGDTAINFTPLERKKASHKLVED